MYDTITADGMKISIRSAVRLLLWLAIASLFARFGDFASTAIPKPYEVLMLLAFLAAAIDFVAHWRARWEAIRALPYARPLALFAFAVLLGSIWSLIRSGSPMDQESILNIGRLGLVLGSFVLLVLYWSGEPKANALPYAFGTVLIYAPAFFLGLDTLYRQLGWIPLRGVDRFQGWSNIIVFGNFAIAAFALLAAKLFEQFAGGRRPIWLRAALIAALPLVAGLVLWSGSRSVWLACLVAGFILVMLVGKNFAHRAQMAAALAAAFVIGFALLPGPIKRNTLVRVYPHYDALYGWYGAESSTTSFELLQQINRDDALLKVMSTGDLLRFQAMGQYAKQMVANPFGWGVFYLQRHGVQVPGARPDIINPTFGADSLYLEILAAGGWLALIAFAWLVFAVMKNGLAQIRRRIAPYLYAGALAALAGLLVSSFFHIGLIDRVLWAVLALAAITPHGAASLARRPRENPVRDAQETE
jgi:hypothetical protein